MISRPIDMAEGIREADGKRILGDLAGQCVSINLQNDLNTLRSRTMHPWLFQRRLFAD